MPTIDELTESLKADGVDANQPIPETQDIIVNERPSLIDQTLAPVKASVTDPVGATLSAVRGVEKSFLDFTPNLTEKIEGTILFPVIRGAELAARMFSNEDYKPELTSLKQIVDERMAYTEALKQRGQGVMEGTMVGLTAVSLAQLGKSAVKVAPEVWENAVKYGSKFYNNKTTKLAEKLLKEGDGPVLDAIVHSPEKVLQVLKNGEASTSDIAFEVGTQLEKTKTGLGTRVDKFKKDFIADPTNRVIVTEPVKVTTPQGTQVDLPSPLQVIEDFKASVTSTDGVSILDGKQTSNLNALEKILTPKSKKTTTSVDKGYEIIQKSMEQTPKDIHPKDAMLAIKAIDKMINYETAIGGGVDAENVLNLMNVRRTLKYQIRGNNLDWFQADEDYANFMELQHGLTSKLKSSDSAESFINNIFGNNKERVRERLQEALNYADFVDTKVGSGDAFFRRLATIQAAKKIKSTQFEVSRPYQQRMNNIVTKWTGAGAAIGAFISNKMGGFNAMGTGTMAGAYAGFKIGQQMANPMRVLDSAIRSKKLSAKALSLAQDLQFVHKTYGNEGVISMLDIIGSIPALNEITKLGTVSQKKNNEELGLSNLQETGE